MYDFYKDQDLLFAYTRYARVRAAKTPEEQAAALYACGYATDPQYAAKLMTIIKSEGLTKYDVIQEDEYMKLTGEQQKMLVAALQQLLDKKVIGDKAWLDKASKGDLTLSELTWLNTIIMARQVK